MSIKDDLAKLGNDEHRKRITKDIPKGWEPSIEYDATGGTLTSVPRTAGDEPDHAELLAEFELDPTKWQITGLRRSKWQRWDGEWLTSYRFTFRRKNSTIDLPLLMSEAKKLAKATKHEKKQNEKAQSLQ